MDDGAMDNGFPPIEVSFNAFGAWADALQALIQGAQLTQFATYAAVCDEVAAESLELYRFYCRGGRLPNGSSLQTAKAGGLHDAAELVQDGFLNYRLHNPLPYADAIEKGTKARDMKLSLPGAEKARRAKDGTLYLIIPFRHSIPGASATGMRPMPKPIHQMAKKLAPSHIAGTRLEPSVTHPGKMVSRNVYKNAEGESTWGDKLTAAQLAKAGHSFKTQSRYAGMYKFGKPGATTHNQFITFRVMSQKSKGWIVPARPGLWLARTAKEEAFNRFGEEMSRALLADLMRFSAF
jgi:hypothetical protein